MNQNEIRESLRAGGEWLGAARNWLLWHKPGADRLTWGSGEVIQMTAKEIEDLALEVAIAALKDAKHLSY